MPVGHAHSLISLDPQGSSIRRAPLGGYTGSLELGEAIYRPTDGQELRGRNGSFYVAGYIAYLIEERRRWPVITASPRGQCSK